MSTPELTPDEHVARLEQDVAAFARHLTEAQDAGVSHALLLPRMMLAFRANFGEIPPELVGSFPLAGSLPPWGSTG